MKFPSLNSGHTQRFEVEALRGGCNLRDGNYCTPDTQLTAAENLWWRNGALRTRPGFCTTAQQTVEVENADVSWKFCSEDTVHGEDTGRRFLRRVYDHTTDTVSLTAGILTYDGRFLFEGGLSGLPAQTQAMAMEYPYTATENVLIFVSDGSVYAQDSTTGDWRSVNEEIYVPCILSGGTGSIFKMAKGYTPDINYQRRNILTDRFCAKYTTTSTDLMYYLPYTDLDTAQTVEIEVVDENGNEKAYTIPAGSSYSEYDADNVRAHVDRARGRVAFFTNEFKYAQMPDASENNMTVYASKARSAEEKRLIATMEFAAWFGGSQAGCSSRQFIGGSAETPNRIYWSEQGQPLYIPEINYIAVGDINQSITAFGKQDGKLVIFKEREIYSLSGASGTVAENQTDGQLAQGVSAGNAYFPLAQLHGQIGCAAPHTVQLCGNRLCWADGTGGVYTLVGSTTGYTVRELSALIAPALTAHAASAWMQADAAVLHGHYLLRVEHTVYVLRIDEKAFHRYASVYDDAAAQQQLAWFRWTLPDSFDVGFMTGNGQAAVLIATVTSGTSTVQMPLCAAEGQADAAWEDAAWKTVPVTALLSTKAYDFGDPAARKRVLRLYLGLETAADTKAHFSYLADGGDAGEAVTLRGVSGNVALTPACARVCRFGVSIETVGTAAIHSVTAVYRR